MIHVPIGTKAQLIKMAPVMKALDDKQLEYQFILTGQHSETMDDLIKDFDLRKPDNYFVKPVEADSKMKLLIWLVKGFAGGYKALKKIGRKDVVLVHGDTLSTLLSAFLGKLKGIKVVHIEAGLRSFNILHPFPEEIVRRLTTKLSDFFVCQDSIAADNLVGAHISPSRLLNTNANTLLDSLRLISDRPVSPDIPDRPYCVVTLHRSENISNSERFTFLMQLVENLSEKIDVLFVMHPVTKKKMYSTIWGDRFEDSKRIRLLNRMPYSEFIQVLESSKFIVSDGGSNQEESYYLGVPCILMRKATERHEGIGSNVVLSNYDVEIFDDFISQAMRTNKRYPTEILESPSAKIAEHLASMSI